MFAVHTTPEEFKNATITAAILDLCPREITWFRDVIVYEMLRFQNPHRSQGPLSTGRERTLETRLFQNVFRPHDNERLAF